MLETSVTIALILVGALLMGVGALQTQRILKLVPAEQRPRWVLLLGMMVFFLVGYLISAVAVVSATERIVLLMMGSVFMGGAFFVYLVVRLGRETIASLDAAAGRERAHAAKAEDALARLQETMESVQRMNRALETSNRELEQFAYVASHDLQEPLRKVKAFGDLLVETEAQTLSEEGKSYVDRMQKAAGRMSSLISDLLEFSRVTRGTEPLEEVNLQTTLEEILEDLETRIDEVGGKVELEALPKVKGRKTQMRQLFQNLVANALKFRREDVAPVVRVVYEEDDKGKRVVVRDNGIGFDPQYADKIFGIFQRLHGRSKYEGTGIGLAICKRIAVGHGWDLVAEGRPDEGATFTLVMDGEAAR